MNTKVIVSVIIPVKNRPGFTSEAIDSVLNQNLPDNVKVELIVVDNRSNPPMKMLLGKKYPNVRFLKNNRFDSPGGSRNKGLEGVKGDFIAFLDSDDRWKRDFLKVSLLEIKKQNSPATVCLTSPYFYGSFPVLKKIKLHILNFIRMTLLLSFWLFNNKRLPKSGFFLCQISHMLFDSKNIKNIKFNEKTAAAEDWEFNSEATRVRPIYVIPQRLVNFRYEPRSNTFSSKVRKGKERAYYDLLNKLPESHTKGVLNIMFRFYIKYFLVK